MIRLLIHFLKPHPFRRDAFLDPSLALPVLTKRGLLKLKLYSHTYAAVTLR